MKSKPTIKRLFTLSLIIASAITCQSTLASGVTITGIPIDEKAKTVLKEILKNAGLDSAKVTSYNRTAKKQATIMYNMCKNDGVDAAYELYSSHADKVIKVYEDADDPVKNKASTIQSMEEKIKSIIKELGDDRKTMMHIDSSYHTIDIAPSSITDKEAFSKAISDHPEAVRYFAPGGAEKAFHIEIKK